MKRIAELARGLTQFRSGTIYALTACAALALALYSCSEPPAQQRQPTVARIAQTSVPPAPTQSPPTNSRPTPSLIPTIPPERQPTLQSMEPTPSPNAVPDFGPMPDNVPFTQLTTGKHHACGLRADGTALCWQSNLRGRWDVPDGMTFRQISAGFGFTCGLRADRAIACWGENNYGQASPPNGRFDEIAAGRLHACALDRGVLTCWGKHFPYGGETIQELPPISAIQSGNGITCGLTANDDIACWISHKKELKITSGPLIDIGIGIAHACAIRVDGSGFCNYEGQDDNLLPIQPPPTKFVQIDVGLFHACGITASSYLECWSLENRAGSQGAPLTAPTKDEVVALDIGWRTTCALRSNGHAVCWEHTDLQTLPPEEKPSPSALLPVTLGDVKLDEPVELFPWINGRLAVVDREGIITTYSDGPIATLPQTILDLTDKVSCCIGESGMLSAALDPRFEKFPFLYIYYNLLSEHAYGENMHGLTGRLSRFRVVDGAVDRRSELTILEAPQPIKLHHGGAVRFGVDGMLYLSIGENGSPENSQSLRTLLGKILRIDVRGATPNKPYRIPPDNPFVNNAEAYPEIWAYGLRNPWRMNFAPDGKLFVADVGHRTQEEVSLATAGANLGWPMCEGNLCEEDVYADSEGLTAPLFTYGRENGCVIIGGVTAPWLNNGFVFGDLCNGKVWLLQQDEREGWRTSILAQAKPQILSFGTDAAGTVYVLMRNKPLIRLHPPVFNEFP